MESNTSVLEKQGPEPAQVVFLPLSDLRAPVWNPRKSMDAAALQTLTSYIQRGGLLPRILVWKGSGQAPFDVISGQRRLEACRRAGKDKVEVEILDITLEEAKDLAQTTNQGEAVEWLEDFESLEARKNEGKLNITQLAERLGRDRAEVSRAMSLMKILNPNSRQMIRENLVAGKILAGQELHNQRLGCDTVTPPEAAQAKTVESEGESRIPDRVWRLKERVAIPLIGLLKDHTEEDAEALVEKALPVILERQMTAAQVDQWVKAGLKPEAPGQKLEQGTRGAGDNGNGTPVGDKAYSGTEVASSSTPAYSADIPRDDSNGQATPTKTGGFLGVVGGLLTGLFASRISNPGGLAGGIKTFILQNLKRALGTMARRWMLHGLVGIGAILLFSPHLFGSLYHLAFGYVVHLPGDGSPGNIAWVKERTALLPPAVSSSNPPAPAPVEPPKNASKPKAGKHTQIARGKSTTQNAGSPASQSPSGSAKAAPDKSGNGVDETVKTIGDTVDTADKAKHLLGF